MTRFNITLGEGVRFVLRCLEIMLGGELFVPKIPSYRITDVARAIAPDAEHQVIGIRAGEKLHEEMITVSDSLNTLEFDDYYVIVPATKPGLTSMLKKKFQGTDFPEGVSYNSETNDRFLSVEELKDLIRKHIH